MGKTVKTVLKIAAVAAIAYFAPVLAPQLLAAVGTTTATALATTVTSAAIGAAAGELSGVGWKAGASAGFMGGAQGSGLFGGGAAAGGGTAAAGATEAATLTPGIQAGVTTPALTSTGGAIGSSTGLSTASAAPAAGGLSTAPAAAAPAAASAAPATLGATLTSAATQVGNAGLAGLKAVAPQLAASVLAGNPGAGLAKAQQEEFFRAQQANASLTQARLDQVNKVAGEADYFDTDFMGRQAAEAATIKGGIQASEETRGLTGARLDAERRRYKLGTARNAGTAYQQGALTGANARYTARATALGAMPTSYPMTSPEYVIAADAAAQKKKAATEAGLSEMFGRILEPKKPVTT